MVNPELKRRTIKATVIYLEMRGYKIIEQNWRQSRYVIEIIAAKDNLMYFIKTSLNSDQLDLSISEADKFKSAVLSWIEDSRYNGKYSVGIIVLDTRQNVLSFSDSLHF